jgi:hypothetical protein
MINISENRTVVEIHGCVLCANLYNILVIYTPEGKLLDCTVTSPGGHIVPDESRPLVVCDSHAKVEIESAHNRRQSTQGKESGLEQEED